MSMMYLVLVNGDMLKYSYVETVKDMVRGFRIILLHYVKLGWWVHG